MATLPPITLPQVSLFNNTAQPASTPYSYGNLGNTTSAYNIWGSQGATNPYITQGPTYTPGLGAPTVPQPVSPVRPIEYGNGDAFPDTTPSATGGGSLDLLDGQSLTDFTYGYIERMGSTQPTQIGIGGSVLDPIGVGLGLVNPLLGLGYTGWKMSNYGEQDPTGVEIVDKSWQSKSFAQPITTTQQAPVTYAPAVSDEGSEYGIGSDGSIDFQGQDYITIDGVGVANPEGEFGYGGSDDSSGGDFHGSDFNWN